MEALQEPLNVSPINYRTRDQIKEHFWPPTILPRYQQDSLDWEPYFRYYTKQCQAALIDRGRFVMARTHSDILNLIHLFNENASRETIKESLRLKLHTRGRPNEDEILDGTIDLAARLYLMVNVAVDARTISEQTRLRWKTGGLKQCLRSHFEEQQILSSSGFRLDPMFTAANLERIAGIRIVQTDNLADHLRLMDRDDTVAVFCNVSFMKRSVRYVRE